MLTEKNLYNYQLTSVGHIINNPKTGLFLDMGLGKTISSLTAVNKLMYDNFEISKVLVIAPKRVAINVWPDEIENWDHVKHLSIQVVNGTEKQRIAALNTPADIHTIGRDNVTWLCNYYGSNLPFDMLIIDESSSFKNHNSLRFKALKLAISSFTRIVLLTGTPAPNSLLDLWAQIYLLDRGERLGRFISHYRNNFFIPNQRNGSIIYNYKLKAKASEQEIYKKIKDICISMKAEDYLDLPGTIVNNVKIEFPPDLQKKYDDFERENILELIDEEITAVNAAALSNKLLQFANGAIYDENRNVHEVHRLKIDACKELIEEANGKPVLIAWTYQHDRDRLLEALKEFNPVQLDDNPQTIKDWNAGKIQVIMMHPASGGHGLNLQKGGNLIIWYGQTWSLELYQQFNKRLDRQGQDQIVVINKLVAHKTHDIDVIKAQEKKAGGQESLMQAVKAKIKQYMS